MPELHAEKVLGFDIEIRPTFKVGDHFPPALLQLAGKNKVFLVQLKKVKHCRRWTLCFLMTASSRPAWP